MTFSSELTGASGEAPVSPNLFVTLPSPETAHSTVFDLSIGGGGGGIVGVGGGGGVSGGGGGGYQNTPVYLNSPSANNANNQVLDSSTGSMGSVETLSKKASLKIKKKQYRNQKKAAANEVASTLNDPSVIVLAEWLKIRGSLKGWTKLFCCLKPGLLILYKSQKMKSSYWVGTILLNSCELIERPSKKEGFCFKLFHPMEQSIWAKNGPSGESIPAIVQPLPVNYLIFRAVSEASGKCWMDALELALRCSTLLKRSIGATSSMRQSRRSDGDAVFAETTPDGGGGGGEGEGGGRTGGGGRGGSVGGGGGSTSGSASSALEESFQSNCSNVNGRHSVSSCLETRSTASTTIANLTSHTMQTIEDPIVSTTPRHNRTGSWTESDLEGHFPRDLDCPDGEDKASIEEEGVSESELSDEEGQEEEDDAAEEEDEEEEMMPYVKAPKEEFGELGDKAQTEEFAEENKSVIWELLKQVRPGMDLSRVVLPAFILEPRSFLDKLSDFYFHCDILHEASSFDDPYLRMKHVLKWYLSGFYKKPKGLKKPYNPILGEVFRCYWENRNTDSKTFYIAEQVSHHPPVSAFYVSNRKDGFCISGSILAKSKFYGNSLQALMDGQARLSLLKRGEDYLMTMPYANCKGILLGTLTMEMGGKVVIECDKTHYRAELEFKLKPFFGGAQASNAVVGKIKLGTKTIATLEGKWDGEIHWREDGESQDVEFWKADSKAIERRLQRFVVPADRQDDWDSERLWRKVSAAIVANDVHAAAEEKGVLEDAQRAATRLRKETDAEVETKLFEKDELLEEWVYKFADSRPWDPHNDMYQFENDFVVGTRTKHKTPVIRTTSLTCVVQKKKKDKRRKKSTSTILKHDGGGSSGDGGNAEGTGGESIDGAGNGAERRSGAVPSAPKVAMLQNRESGSSTGSVYRPEDSESSEDSKGGGGGGGGVGGATTGGGRGGNESEIKTKSSHPASSLRSGSPQKQMKRTRIIVPAGGVAEDVGSVGGGGGGGGGSGGLTAEELKKAMEPMAHQILQLRRTIEAHESERRNGSLTKKDFITIAIVLGMQLVVSWILLR